MNYLISKERVSAWQTQSTDDPIGLYTEIVDKLEALFESDKNNSIYASILRNVNDIYRWQTSGDSRLEQSAREFMVNARLLLGLIEASTSLKSKSPQFFSPKTILSDMMKGGHVLIEDEGELLNDMLQAKALFKRYSSHYKQDKIAEILRQNPRLEAQAAETLFNQDKPDFSLRAEVIFNESVFGKITKEDGKTYTWFQFEGHSHQAISVYQSSVLQALDALLQCFHYSIEKLLHHVDLVEYVWNGKNENIGQYGLSEFTEKNPLMLAAVEEDIEQTERSERSVPAAPSF